MQLVSVSHSYYQNNIDYNNNYIGVSLEKELHHAGQLKIVTFAEREHSMTVYM